MVEDRDENREIGEGDQHQTMEKKRKRARKIGAVLLLLGGIYGCFAYGVCLKAESAAERAGASIVPLLFCLFGFYFFFKGGGKVK